MTRAEVVVGISAKFRDRVRSRFTIGLWILKAGAAAKLAFSVILTLTSNC